MSTLAAFNRQLADFQKQVEKAAVEKFQTLITMLADEVVTRTPIDTSRARSNWQTTIGSPASAEVPFVMGAAGSTASQAHKIAMASALSAAKAVRLGNKVYIANCVPYIRDLNRGTSPQAPPNFVEHAVNVAKAKLSK